jgi:hypothetical protein
MRSHTGSPSPHTPHQVRDRVQWQQVKRRRRLGVKQRHGVLQRQGTPGPLLRRHQPARPLCIAGELCLRLGQQTLVALQLVELVRSDRQAPGRQARDLLSQRLNVGTQRYLHLSPAPGHLPHLPLLAALQLGLETAGCGDDAGFGHQPSSSPWSNARCCRIMAAARLDAASS